MLGMYVQLHSFQRMFHQGRVSRVCLAVYITAKK